MVPVGDAWAPRVTNVRSPELAMYLRTEFRGADAEWMGARIRKEATRTMGLRARLARRRARGGEAGTGRPSELPPAPAGDRLRPEFPLPVDGCPHEDVDPMGRDGSTWFGRCRGCGVLLIESFKSVYLLRPGVSTAQRAPVP